MCIYIYDPVGLIKFTLDIFDSWFDVFIFYNKDIKHKCIDEEISYVLKKKKELVKKNKATVQN